MLEPICLCGHRLEDHEGDFFRVCLAEDCECTDFEIDRDASDLEEEDFE